MVDLVKKQYCDLERELNPFNVDFSIVQPTMEDRFFSMVIGKGYVPPTFLFRWCTKRLRIRPMQQICKANEKVTVLLGIRKGESATRDGVISAHKTNNCYYTRQAGYPNTDIFCPIINFTVEDVWETITSSIYPLSIARKQICDLYSYVGTVFSKEGLFICDNQQGRYGCWTCTVVRNDKAMNGLISNGYLHLMPLRDFMNWLRRIRDNEEMRDPNRITNQAGKGPFNIKTRMEILDRLFFAEQESGLCLIDPEQLNYIYKIWK